jgi:hypothetical protein
MRNKHMEIKIEKRVLVIFALLVIVGVSAFVLRWRQRANSEISLVPRTSSAATSVPQNNPLTQENSEGGVTVSVTPLQIDPGASEYKFEVATNTHTVDMASFDPASQIMIQDAQGNLISSTTLERAGSGHHQSMTIFFPNVPKPWKLIVRNLSGVPLREFVW